MPSAHAPARRLLLALLLAATGPAAFALDAPKGKVVLSISGKIGPGNAAGRADFDMAMLEALPQHSFATSTPWFKVARKFTGPLLRDVLAAAGAQGNTLVAVALIAVFGMVRPALRAVYPPPPAPESEKGEAGGQLSEVSDDQLLLGPGGLPALEAPLSNEKLERARLLARENPTAVASIVRNWVNGEVA